jgi:hypothetical protein
MIARKELLILLLGTNLENNMSNSIIDNQRDQEIMKRPERKLTLVEMLFVRFKNNVTKGIEHQEKIYREHFKYLSE